VTALVAVERAS
jgi:hypothetical protein